MDVFIPTHISYAIGESIIRSIVAACGTSEHKERLLCALKIQVQEATSGVETVENTLETLLDRILPPQEDSDTDSDTDTDSESDSE